MTLCDVYDALTSPRHYRGKQASRSAEEVLLGMALPGGQFDFSYDRNLLRQFIAYKLDDPKIKLSPYARAVLKDVAHGGYTTSSEFQQSRPVPSRVAFRPAA